MTKACPRCSKRITRPNYARHVKACGNKKPKIPRKTVLRTYYIKHRDEILKARREDAARLQYFKYTELLEQARRPAPVLSAQPRLSDFRIPPDQPFIALAGDALMYQRAYELIFYNVEFTLDSDFLSPRWVKNVLRLLHVGKFHLRLAVPENKRDEWHARIHSFTQAMNDINSMDPNGVNYMSTETSIREALRSAAAYGLAVTNWERDVADHGKCMKAHADKLDHVRDILRSDKWKQYGECSSWEQFKATYLQRFEQADQK